MCDGSCCYPIGDPPWPPSAASACCTSAPRPHTTQTCRGATTRTPSPSPSPSRRSPGSDGPSGRARPLGPETQQLEVILAGLGGRGGARGGGAPGLGEHGPVFSQRQGMVRAPAARAAWPLRSWMCGQRLGPRPLRTLLLATTRRTCSAVARSDAGSSGGACPLAEHLSEAFVRAQQFVAKNSATLPGARLKTLQVGRPRAAAAACMRPAAMALCTVLRRPVEWLRVTTPDTAQHVLTHRTPIVLPPAVAGHPGRQPAQQRRRRGGRRVARRCVGGAGGEPDEPGGAGDVWKPCSGAMESCARFAVQNHPAPVPLIPAKPICPIPPRRCLFLR